MPRPAYTYEQAGFNGFFQRSLVSDPSSIQLVGSRSSQTNQLNFDQLQISGALGDKLKVGVITIDGKTGRISMVDDQGNEVMRLGNIDV